MMNRSTIPLIAVAAIAAEMARGRPIEAAGTETQVTTTCPQGSFERQP